MDRLEQRTLILMRQAGNVAGDISFYTRTPDNEAEKKKGLKLHLKCDLGDLILQTKMLIKDLGLDENEIMALAYERYDECKQEFKAKGKSQYFI